jgi:hypothetical protein
MIKMTVEKIWNPVDGTVAGYLAVMTSGGDYV